MTAPVACAKCGKALTTSRRLKSFCSYACRGQYKAQEATGYRSGLVRSKNTKQNRTLQSLKRQAVGAATFAKINSPTIRVDRRGKNGAGWLVEVAWPGGVRGRWVARVGDMRSEPLPLDGAKQAAVAFLREKEKPRTKPNHIQKLNQIAANEVDRAALQRERKRWPIDLMNGRRRGFVEQGHAIIEAELAMPSENNPALEHGDYRLDHHADGYPKLPECLTRIAKPERFSDAA
jgi:hypothetical protein